MYLVMKMCFFPCISQRNTLIPMLTCYCTRIEQSHITVSPKIWINYFTAKTGKRHEYITVIIVYMDLFTRTYFKTTNPTAHNTAHNISSSLMRTMLHSILKITINSWKYPLQSTPTSKFLLQRLTQPTPLALGMKVAKINCVLVFQQNPWLKSYTNIKWEHTANNFKKDFYKLMNNSVFGKTMYNLRKQVNVKLVNDKTKLSKLILSPSFNAFCICLKISLQWIWRRPSST